MALRYTDYDGHDVPDGNANVLTAGAAGTSAVGTIVPNVTGLGASGALSNVVASDRAGSFTLAASGTPAAGEIGHVYFAKPYAAAPTAVLLNATNTTDSTASITVAPGSITVAGFAVISTVPTTAKSYQINYLVVV